MSSEVKAEPKLEIGHVLFMDIVGYSKLLVDEQSHLQQQLKEIVRDSTQVRAAETSGKLIRVPTGDGMALVFFTNPEAPAQCALEISRALKDSPQIKMRMGVHSGPINKLADVNEQTNVAGGGINTAQRVMDCGDAGHILLSKRVAEDLTQYGRWQAHLHDLGECEVKHGVKIHVVNLCTDDAGNCEIPSKFKRASEEQTALARRAASAHRRKLAVIAAAIVVVLLLAFLFLPHGTLLRSASTVAGAVFDKSIAVLPFENFSAEKESAYFADGIQDEILTDLSKVADLKVISRTSVMQYRGVARNLKEIGQALGVAFVLEGSVQKAGSRVRVNTQLIDTHTDAHVWAEKFDRELSDIFIIQTELAEKIVAQLRANLTPREKAAITDRTTNDVEAYDLYLRSKKPGKTAFNEPFTKEEYFEAERLINMAIARDPKFALAYCRLMQIELDIYWLHDHDPGRTQKAEEAVKTAMHLRPDVGEVRLAQATYFYQANRDYDQARTALDVASRMLPNNSEIFQWSAAIDRKHGKWDDALTELQRALEIDPRNPEVLQNLLYTYISLRQYSEAERIIERGLASFPESAVEFQLAKLEVAFSRGDTQTCRALSLVFGIGNEKTNVSGVLNSYHRNSIFSRDRGFSADANPPSTNSSPLNLQLSRDAVLAAGGIPPSADELFFGRVPFFSNGLAPASDYTYTTFRSSFYNFELGRDDFSESERYGGYVNADHQVCGAQMVLYADVFYQNVKTHSDQAASATSNFQTPGQTTLAIPPHAPGPTLGGPSYAETGLPFGAFNPFNPFQQIISGGTRARLAEFGNRLINDETDAFFSTLGVRGDKLFDGSWGYDGSFRYSQIKNTETDTLVSASRFNRILNAADPIFDPT